MAAEKYPQAEFRAERLSTPAGSGSKASFSKHRERPYPLGALQELAQDQESGGGRRDAVRARCMMTGKPVERTRVRITDVGRRRWRNRCMATNREPSSCPHPLHCAAPRCCSRPTSESRTRAAGSAWRPRSNRAFGRLPSSDLPQLVLLVVRVLIDRGNPKVDRGASRLHGVPSPDPVQGGYHGTYVIRNARFMAGRSRQFEGVIPYSGCWPGSLTPNARHLAAKKAAVTPGVRRGPRQPGGAALNAFLMLKLRFGNDEAAN